MDKISIICCYNNEEKLTYLTDSLDEQDISCERILVDNSKNRFSSAAAALNYGASKASGSLLFFVHQDIRFTAPHALRELAEKAEVLSDRDIGGIAGAVFEDRYKKTITNMTYSPEEKHYRGVFKGDYVLTESVDECLFIMRKEAWEAHHFDEEICDHWHFYAVEQCLYFRKEGGKIYTFDCQVNHLSETGTLDKSFFRALFRLRKYYRKDYPYITATTGYWPFASLYRMARRIAATIRDNRR